MNVYSICCVVSAWWLVIVVDVVNDDWLWLRCGWRWGSQCHCRLSCCRIVGESRSFVVGVGLCLLLHGFHEVDGLVELLVVLMRRRCCWWWPV